MGAINDSPIGDQAQPGSIAAEHSVAAELKSSGIDWVRRTEHAAKPAHPPMAAAVLMVSVVLLLLAIGLVSVL